MRHWSEIEKKREELGLSRAEMCRRAGISESTVFKGLQKKGTPSNAVRKALTNVFRESDEELRA